MSWEHYDDLPFEVVVVQVNDDGELIGEELVRRHSLRGEAEITRRNNQASLVDPLRFRVELRDLRGGR